MVQWIRLHGTNAGGPGLIPGQGTRSHMHAATKSSYEKKKKRVHMPQLRSPCAASKEPASHN